MKQFRFWLVAALLLSVCAAQDNRIDDLLDELGSSPEVLEEVFRSGHLAKFERLIIGEVIDRRDLNPPSFIETDEDLSIGNCPFNEVLVRGEKVHVRGGGGFYEASPKQPAATPDEAARLIQDNLSLSQAAPSLSTNRSANGMSAIMIVDDDFDLPNHRTQMVVSPPTLSHVLADIGHNPAAKPERDTERLQKATDTGDLTHGDLVLHHTLNVLYALSPNYSVKTQRVTQPSRLTTKDRSLNRSLNNSFIGFDTVIVEFPDLNLVVATVPTNGYQTGLIASRLAAALETLTSGYRVDDVAVNMSFGLVPCSVVSQIAEHRKKIPEYTMLNYAEDVLNNYYGENGFSPLELQAFLVALLRPIEPEADPLRRFIQLSIDADDASFLIPGRRVPQLAYVASAGNYKLSFPLYPAAWPEVISVSASVKTQKTGYSNSGEDMLPGNHVLTLPGRGSVQPVAVAGTSFAAPVLAAFAALDMSSPSPRCTYFPPSLAHYDFFNLGSSKLTRTNPNLRLRNALVTLCP